MKISPKPKLGFFVSFALCLACDAADSSKTQISRVVPLPKPVSHVARENEFDVLHYELRLQVDPEKKSFEGEVSIRFKPLAPEFKTLSLDCGDYEVRNVQLGQTRLAFEQKAETLRIGLPSVLKAGDETTVRIQYGKRPSRGIYFIGPDADNPRKPYEVYTQGECEDIRYVFPCYDYPNDKATSEMYVTVPRKFKTVAAGKLIESSTDDANEARTDHWKMDIAHSSYLTTLAVGEFSEVTDEWDGIPISYYGDAGDEAALKLSFGKTPKAMQFFSEYIGVKYPYPKYAQVCVHDFMFGGMENISATTQTRTTLHKESSEPIANSDGLMAHELAHQWWGDLVTCRDWSQIWLNEGFATYFEALFRESDRGLDEFRYAMRGAQDAAMDAERKQPRGIVHSSYVDPLDVFFSGHVYPGGASRLHMLRFILGDEKFRAGIRLYAQRFREKNVTTDDFRAAMEEASGVRLEEFFQQWIYGKGFPEFRVDYTWDEESSCMRARVEQTQIAGPNSRAAYRTPVDFEFTFADNSKEKQRFRVQLSERSETFIFRLPAKPLLMRFDPDGWIVKSLTENKTADELAYQLERDESVVGRFEAARTIRKMLEKKAEAQGLDLVTQQKLIDALLLSLQTEKFYGVQMDVLEALALCETERVQNVLIQQLRVEQAFVRRKIVWALGGFKGEPKVWNALKNLFDQEKNDHVAAAIPSALVRSKYPQVREFLSTALKRESDADCIATAALNAFVEAPEGPAFTLCMQFAAPGYPYPLRIAALQGLGKLGSGRLEARQLALHALDGSWARIRVASLEALGQIGEGVDIPRLELKYSKETFPSVRRAYEKAIRNVASRSAEPRVAMERKRLEARKEEIRAQKRRIDAQIIEQKSLDLELDSQLLGIDAEIKLIDGISGEY